MNYITAKELMNIQESIGCNCSAEVGFYPEGLTLRVTVIVPEVEHQLYYQRIFSSYSNLQVPRKYVLEQFILEAKHEFKSALQKLIGEL